MGRKHLRPALQEPEGFNLDYLAKILAPCPGWCTIEKAAGIAKYMMDRNVTLSVDIGVYGGRSLFPQAYVHKKVTGGMAYGMDPWTFNDALQEDVPDVNERIKSINFEGVYQGVLAHVKEFGLEKHCTIWRKKSSDVVDEFQDNSIGFLHIDGNHGEKSVIQDITLYLPKMKSGGVIWFDDLLWATTQKAIEYAKEHCKLLQVFDRNDIVFEKS